MMKTNFFNRIDRALCCSALSIVSLTATAVAQQIPALTGIDRVSVKHGGKFIQKIVEMKGYKGQSQPEEWELIVYDPSSEYLLREFWVGDTRATNEGVNYDYYPKKQPPGFIDVRKLKLGSVEAFKILDREAAHAKIGFDSIDYHLRCREFSTEPIWTLTAKDDDGYQVARVDLSGETGRVLRTVWSYRDGRKVPVIKDSALRRPEPLEIIDDDELERRRLARDRELIGPARRKEPVVPEPIDPAPVEDPGTEVPEVVPIEPGERTVPDEP